MVTNQAGSIVDEQQDGVPQGRPVTRGGLRLQQVAGTGAFLRPPGCRERNRLRGLHGVQRLDRQLLSGVDINPYPRAVTQTVAAARTADGRCTQHTTEPTDQRRPILRRPLGSFRPPESVSDFVGRHVLAAIDDKEGKQPACR